MLCYVKKLVYKLIVEWRVRIILVFWMYYIDVDEVIF